MIQKKHMNKHNDTLHDTITTLYYNSRKDGKDPDLDLDVDPDLRRGEVWCLNDDNG